MMNKNRAQSLGMMIGCVLAIITLCGAAVGPSKPVGEVALAPTSLLYGPSRYGTIYIYDTVSSEWDPEDIGAMEEALNGAKNLGLDTIVQTFPAGLLGGPNEAYWLHFLDVAEVVGIDVVAYLWPNNTYTGDPDDPFYYDDLKAFLDVIGNHPALLGYIGLHEPLEPHAGISDDELEGFYTEMKQYAQTQGLNPNLKIAHYLGNIAYWEEHRDDFTFSDGMCDICMVWYYPFCYVDGDPVFEEDMVLAVLQPNVALVDERDPDAELWFLGQAFAQSAHWRNLRMPTADEIEDLYLLVMQEPVDGFMWYPWYHTEVMDASLGDEGMEEQQEAVGNIADSYIPPRIYLPLIMAENINDLDISIVFDKSGSMEFDMLVVRELDRFARSLAKQLVIEGEFKRHGVEVEYILGEYPDTPEGRLNKHIRATIAEFEREKIAQRMTRGRRNVVKSGKVMLHGDNKAPYGYRHDNGRLVVCDEEAKVVHLIYTWYVHGDGINGPLSIRQITRCLTKMEILTHADQHPGRFKKSGKGVWSPSVVAAILSNETHCGLWGWFPNP